MILQKIIEILSKKSYEALIQEKVFDKLGMEHSTFSPKEYRTVQGYGEDGHPLPGKWAQQPELAAAGLWSTSEDLIKVAVGIQKSLENESFLGKVSAKAMITPFFDKEISELKEELDNLNTNPSTNSEKRITEIQERLKDLQESAVPGLGVFIEKTNEATYFHHSGSNLGFRCLMVGNDQGQGAVVMTNSEFGDELIPEIVRRIAEVYDWKGRDSFSPHLFPPLHPEVVETSRKDLETDFVKKWLNDHRGYYENDKRPGKVVEVNEKDGKIFFKPPDPPDPPGGKAPSIELTPVSEHVGIIKENGRWVPIEFSNNEVKKSILTIHGMTHTKMK
jgi:hypothetical protein